MHNVQAIHETGQEAPFVEQENPGVLTEAWTSGRRATPVAIRHRRCGKYNTLEGHRIAIITAFDTNNYY